MDAYDGPPMTLGTAAVAKVRLIVWCKDVSIGLNLIRPRRRGSIGHRCFGAGLNGT